MKTRKRNIRPIYVRPGFGWGEADETRRRRRAVLALTVIELFLLMCVIALAVDVAGG